MKDHLKKVMSNSQVFQVQKTSPQKVLLSHLDRYMKITCDALAAARTQTREGKGKQCIAMAEQYVSDAKYFASKGDRVRAFACLNYAHGWLDCAAMLGLIVGPTSDIERWSKK